MIFSEIKGFRRHGGWRQAVGIVLFLVQVLALVELVNHYSTRLKAGEPLTLELVSKPMGYLLAMVATWAALQFMILRHTPKEGDLRWAGMLLTSLPLAFIVLAIANRML